MTLSFPLAFTDRFALIIRALHAAVAARIRCPPVTAEIIVFVCARLRRIAQDFERLAGQIRAGTYVARHCGQRRAGGAGSRRGASIVLLHYRLGLPPWQPAWLHRVAQGDAGVWAEALRNLVSEPGMAAVIAAVPRMRRILRPLCFMLGLEASLLRPRAPVPVPAVPVAMATDGIMAPCPLVVEIAPACAPHASGETRPFAARSAMAPGGEIFRLA